LAFNTSTPHLIQCAFSTSVIVARTSSRKCRAMDVPGGRAFVGSVGTRSRIPMGVLLRAYVGELIRSVVKQMTLRKEKGTPLLFYEMKSLTF